MLSYILSLILQSSPSLGHRPTAVRQHLAGPTTYYGNPEGTRSRHTPIISGLENYEKLKGNLYVRAQTVNRGGPIFTSKEEIAAMRLLDAREAAYAHYGAHGRADKGHEHPMKMLVDAVNETRAARGDPPIQRKKYVYIPSDD